MKEKLTTVIATILILACVGCGEIQMPNVNAAHLLKSAQCIEAGVQCSLDAYVAIDAQSQGSTRFLAAMESFDRCVLRLTALGCDEAAQESLRLIQEMTKKEKEKGNDN